MDEEMMTLKDILRDKKQEQETEIKAREKMEHTLKQSTEAWEKRENDIKMKSSESKNLKEQVTKFEFQLQNERNRNDKIEKERDQVAQRAIRLQQEHDELSIKISKLLNENHEQAQELKTWEENTVRLKENFKMMTRTKESLAAKFKSVDEAKMNAEMERDALRSSNSHLARDLEFSKKELDECQKELEMAVREREIAQKNFVKSTGANQKQLNVIRLSEQSQRNLEQEIQGYKDEATKMRKVLYIYIYCRLEPFFTDRIAT